MNKKFIRRACFLMLLALGVPAAAQQAKQSPRIGFLSGRSASSALPDIEAFRHGLRELGYIEGQNILIEYRWAEGQGNRYSPLAAELVGLGVDVIVTSGTRATLAAKQVTGSIPIIVGLAGDLVGEGLVASLARPGGNVTGFTNIQPDLSAKRLQIFKEALPKISRVAVLLHGGPGGDDEELKETHLASKKLGVRIQPLLVPDPEHFSSMYAAMRQERAQALIIFGGSFTALHQRTLLDLAVKIRLPTMCGNATWAQAGALISYGHDPLDQWQRAAGYADKVLKGTKPADLPVQQPMKFELVVNLKTAKEIGVTIEPNLLVRATKVIR